MFSYALKLTGNVHSAQDLIQEAILGCLRTAENYRSPISSDSDLDNDDFRNWIFSAIRSRNIDIIRKRSRRRECLIPSGDEDEGLDEWLFERNFYDHGHIERRVYADTLSEMKDAVEKLKPVPAAVLRMHFFQGKTYSKISQDLGIKLGYALSAAYKGRQRIKRELELGTIWYENKQKYKLGKMD